MLKVSNISKCYGNKKALNNLSFEIKEGETLGIIGQNGAGKSTTFKILMNFIQPTSGDILWNNHPIKVENRYQFGFMPEERGLYQNETILSQMLYFGELHGMSHLDLRINLDKWMQKLDVVGRKTDKVKNLSKGNAQKIQLIAVLMFHPKLIILDEPFSGLDPVNAQILSDAILETKKLGSMIIFSSHNMDNVEQISDEIIMLKHGNVVLQGKIDDIYQNYTREYLTVSDEISIDFFRQYKGILDLKQEKNGNITMRLAEERIGKRIFKDITTKCGYIPVFSQMYPSLEEIFKRKVSDK